MRTHRQHITATAGAAVVLSLTLAACGTSDGGDTLDAVDAHAEATAPVADSSDSATPTAILNPVWSFDRLADLDCIFGYGQVGDFGLTDYSVVDDVMVSLDITTGETTEHGAPPYGCQTWLGDAELGRAIAVKENFQTYSFGPLGGPWETEVVFDTPSRQMNRSLAGNRLVLVTSNDGLPPFTSAFLVDATTGEMVGSPIEGDFLDGRTAIGAATSPNKSLIAVTSLGLDNPLFDGRVFVLDAATGDEVFQLDLPRAVGLLAFENDTTLFGASPHSLFTIDIETREVVSEVRTSAALYDSNTAIGVRPDGLIVVGSNEHVELVDRITGPIGVLIELPDNVSGRVLPDGSYASFTPTGQVEVYQFED